MPKALIGTFYNDELLAGIAAKRKNRIYRQDEFYVITVKTEKEQRGFLVVSQRQLKACNIEINGEKHGRNI